MEFLRQINSRTKNELGRVVQTWIAYVLVSKLLLIFPHWEITLIALLNYDLFFLMFLLAARIFLAKHDNRYVYLNLAVFSILYVSGFFTIFLGKSYAIGNDFHLYYFYVYRKIAIGIITCVTIIYISIDFLYYELKLLHKYLITISLTLLFSFSYYKNFFLDSGYLFQARENYLQVFTGLLAMNFLALFFILLYGFLKIQLDKPIAGHVNVLLFSFSFFLAIDSVDNFFNSNQKTIPQISQIFLVFTLIYFIAVLVHNYLYINTEYSRFIHDIRFRRRILSMRLIQRSSYVEKYFLLAQKFLRNLPYQMFLRLFMVTSILFFLYYYPYGYFKMSFVVLIFLTMIMIVYLNLLIKKRSRAKALDKESHKLTQNIN